MNLAPSKLGPGNLKFGETGSEIEFAILCSKIEIAPEISDEEQIYFLDNTSFKPEGEYSGSITGTIHQDYSLEGLVAWTWKNAGKTVPFTFKPSTSQEMTIKGRCFIKPVKIGGDVKKHNTSDFDFSLVGGLPTMEKTEATE